MKEGNRSDTSKGKSAFPYRPTADQKTFFEAFGAFLRADSRSRPLFLMKGYAGTGKTTAVRAVVQRVEEKGWRTVLLAPTGRAAKVMEQYTGKKAYTIHKWIYWSRDEGEGALRFVLAKNKMRKTLFLIDEASMISGKASRFMERELFQDLLEFVHSGTDCRALLIGDDAQLPPVGVEESPALDPEALRREGVELHSAMLTEVLRQSRDSGILANATSLRERIRNGDATPPFLEANVGDDLRPLTGEILHEELETALGEHGPEGLRFITRSNKRAVQFNHEIRARILGREEELEGGDLLMVVRNDHYWGKQTASGSFIANGDTLELVRILEREERYGERFVHAWVRSSDRPDDGDFEVKLWVDCLSHEGASMPRERMKSLFYRIGEEYRNAGKGSWKRKVMQDPYFNALQVKYAYAVTCHKAQGGQWPVVFLDPGFLRLDQLDVEYLRWLYTGFTRASERLYLVNFPAELFVDDPYSDLW